MNNLTAAKVQLEGLVAFIDQERDERSADGQEPGCDAIVLAAVVLADRIADELKRQRRAA